MAIPEDEVFHLLPNKPPDDLIPSLMREVLNTLPPIERHILSWTIALSEAFERLAHWRNIPGYRFPAFGLADQNFEGDEFGVFAYAHPIPGMQDTPRSFMVGQQTFRIFIRRPFEIYHGSPTVHPSGGRSACWASSSKYSQQALLTARHVLEKILQRAPQLQDTIPMDHHQTTVQGTVVDLPPDGIDAALVAPPGNPSVGSGGNHFDAIPLVTPWMDAVINAASSSVTTKITAVTDTRGSLHHRLPARVFTKDHGQPGDSGSLVIDPASSKGVGIYMGKLADLSGRTEGFSQHLGQVVYVMNLTLLD